MPGGQAVTLYDFDGNPIQFIVNPETNFVEFPVNLRGHVCEENSSTTALVADDVFEGEWQDTLDYGTVTIGIKTDQNSIIDGLEVLWSADGITVDDSDIFTILANEGKVFTFGPARRYVKVKYTNDGADQTSFRLQTILRRVAIKPSSHRINDSIVAEDDAELVKAVLTGENPAGTFVNFQSTTAGNFKISLEELENTISSNSNSQLNTTLFDSNGVELSIDPTTGAICTAENEHCEIHEGMHFYNKDWVDLANGATYDILLITPDTTQWSHFTFVMSAEAEFNVELFIDPTVSANGTSLTFVNRNGNSSNTATLLGYHTPTVTTTGTTIARYKGGSGQKVGGEVRANNEVVLKQNTLFLARITNDTALNNWVDWLIDFYEHTNS